MIDVHDLTLTYPSGKGVFELDFSIYEGEIMGYLGPNGAGKTTTIRALLGFMRPDIGSCAINGLDCSYQAPAIQRVLGYIPGEITFLDSMNGDEFLRFIQAMRQQGKDDNRLKQLLDRFELDPRGKIRKFSKGMKQKLGIVTAFMHDPAVYVLDEPTSGLDPLMQNRFVDLVLHEKKRGKTILMSSHSFAEVERTCDRAIIIKEGRIIRQDDVRTLQDNQRRVYLLKVGDAAVADDARRTLEAAGFSVSPVMPGTLEVVISGEQIDQLIKTAAQFTVSDFDAKNQTLEEVFMQYYGKEGDECSV